MSCLNPSFVYVFYDKVHDKRFVKLLENVDKNIFEDGSVIGKLEASRFDKTNQVLLHGVLEKSSFVPCGHCIGCALDHSKLWSMRMQLEMINSVNAYFLTLTYNDDNLPANYNLVKTDLQSFIKKLKRYFYDNFDYTLIRYYACGEYGSTTARPHYHLIVYNLPVTPDDFKTFFNYSLSCHEHNIGRSIDGTCLFHIDWLDNLWGKGFVSVGSATAASMAYVARYVNKKKLLTKEEKETLRAKNIQPEFNLMSLKPGIGADYYLKHKDDILKNNLSVYLNGKTYSVDRYFYKLIERYGDENDLSVLDKIRDFKSKVFNLKSDSDVVRFAYDYNSMFKNRGVVVNEKFKLLKRSL